MITIYCDGAYDFKRDVGGWAAILIDEDGKETELSGHVLKTTGNRMEIMGAMQGLFTLSRPSRVHIITDAKYLEDSFNKGWLHRWVEEEQFDRPHFDLWRLLYNLDKIHDITMEWVKGHAGNHYNERADKLATGEVKKIVNSKKKAFYAVAVGREVGVFATWDECKERTFKYPAAKFKKFESLKEAEQYIERNRKK